MDDEASGGASAGHAPAIAVVERDGRGRVRHPSGEFYGGTPTAERDVTDYRIDYLNHDHRVALAIIFEAPDDDRATACAGAMADGRDMELWCGGRHVRAFAASDTPSRIDASDLRWLRSRQG